MAHQAKATAASPARKEDQSKDKETAGFKLAEPPKTIPKQYQYEGDPVLKYAWELYETYSQGSSNQKNENTHVRRVIIILIFLTSTLAIFGTLPGINFAGSLVIGLVGWVPFLSGLAAWLASVGWGTVLSISLIILSVATTAMLSYASQFTPMKAWIMYRIGAERIRTEIYMYRLQAGRYEELEPNSEEMRRVFLRQIEAINRQIYELETSPPFLQMMGEDEEELPTPKPSGPRRFYNALTTPFRWVFVKPAEWLAALRRDDDSNKVEMVTSVDGTQVPKDISGRYYPEHDHGFNKLRGQDYIDYRAIPQRDWYVAKVYEDYEQIKDWRRVLLTVGGASAVLAALQKEPFIVVTTAATVAINTHLQLNLIGSTYGNYHLTASRLDSEIIRWRNAPNRESSEEVARLVETIERILEDERSVWMQQASQAQKETEQTLIKGAGKREGISAIDNKYFERDFGIVKGETDDEQADGDEYDLDATPTVAAQGTDDEDDGPAEASTTTDDSTGKPGRGGAPSGSTTTASASPDDDDTPPPTSAG